MKRSSLFVSQVDSLKRSPIGDAVRLAKVTWGFLSGTVSGLQEFYSIGAISHTNWEKLLWAHCATNGRLTSLLSPLFRVLRPPRGPTPVTGLLGHFSVQEQQKIVAELNRNGFYVFSSLMPAEICDEIETFAKETPAVTESNRSQSEPFQKYNPEHPLSRTYKIRETDSVHNAAVQKIMSDQVFAAVAEQYLNTQSSIGGVDLWWSAPYGNEPGSDAAQLFHFDFDAPPAWLKLFVYVTDVGPDNGPHIYVKGSHKAGLAGAGALRARGYERISDVEIEQVFGRDAVAEICGPRGTVFVADTRGFHKGKMPVAGHRLLAQMIYCSSMFNDHGIPTKLPEKVDPALAATLRKWPRVYERFL